MYGLPLVTSVLEARLFATIATTEKSKKECADLRRKSLMSVFLCPRFAAKWFRILKATDMHLISTNRPLLYLKPFRVYMSTRWNKEQKLKVIIDTYRFILNRRTGFDDFIRDKKGLEIARFTLSDGLECTLHLGYDDRYRKEGEFVLTFNCDKLGGIIVAAAFAFEELTPNHWIARIGCIQGQNTIEEKNTKLAQKSLYGMRPKAFIIFGIQELVRQLGFMSLYGSGDEIQAYRGKHMIHLPWCHAISFDYNAIWLECGGYPAADGWFEIPLVPIRKRMDDIKTHKRGLYKKRYQLLDEISMQIESNSKALTNAITQDDMSLHSHSLILV